jgi:hypothetical protein
LGLRRDGQHNNGGEKGEAKAFRNHRFGGRLGPNIRSGARCSTS